MVLTDAQIEAAEGRGRELMEYAPRAVAGRFDRQTGRIELTLANGGAFAFPARSVQDLQGAAEKDLARVEVDGLGFNLHWPTLDVDLYVPALVTTPATDWERADRANGPVP